MDRFITITKEKENGEKIIGRSNIISIIKHALDTNKTICIYGDSGVGKTYVTESIIKRYNYIDLDQPILKSKKSTLEFLDKSKLSPCHVLIDDSHMDVPGWKEITQHISEGNTITRGATIILARDIHKIDFCECVHMEHAPIRDFVSIGSTRFPHVTIETLIEKANKSRGDIRSFLFYLDFSGEKDMFFTPKGFVHQLVSKNGLHPADYIGEVIEDHGYSSGIIHENYIDAVSKSDDFHRIIDYISHSDSFDNKLYEGNWSLTPYFCTESIIAPAMYIGNTLRPETMRPGSCWTKYNNFKMRKGKLQSIYARTGITTDHTLLLRDYCIHDPDKAYEIMCAYNLEAADLDTINHIAMKTKIKPKTIQKLKTRLKNEKTNKVKTRLVGRGTG